jgi:hypothetical protein
MQPNVKFQIPGLEKRPDLQRRAEQEMRRMRCNACQRAALIRKYQELARKG